MKSWLQAVFLASIAWALACAPTHPARPTGVPADAEWVGRAGAGHWILCGMGGKEPAAFFSCTIYDDQKGTVVAQGEYALGELVTAPDGSKSWSPIGTPFPRLDYEFFDGEKIHLGGTRALLPDGEKDHPFGT